MVHYPAKLKSIGAVSRVAGVVALAAVLGAGVYAQEQEQQAQQQSDAQQPSQDAPPTPPKPTYTPQDADKPPYSHDRPAQNVPDVPPPPAQSVPAQSVPGTLTVPAGTILLVRVNDYLSSDRNQIGDHFTAVLENPLVVNGWVVARRGQVLVGQVKEARKAGRIKGTSELGVELTDLTVVDGRQVPILTELSKGSGGTSHGQDAATIGTTTWLGALIGAAADWGTGAAIGAGAGAAAGIGAVLLTRGRPTILEPEAQLSFRLVDPVHVDTTKVSRRFSPSRSWILTAANWNAVARAAWPVAILILARMPIPVVTTVRATPIPAPWDFMAAGAGALAFTAGAVSVAKTTDLV